MERVFRKPVAFVLTITLIFGAFVFPSFAGSSIYSEASIANDVDTGFEKQSEISEVKTQSFDGARTLNSDSHSGRFSLKLGKAGLEESVLCHIINSNIDLSKYNQVSMWVKPKGYNIPFTLYTDISGTRTTIGSIEVATLKADVWQQVTFDLSSVSATVMHGLYAYGYPGKSLLIDDISFSKLYANSESWDLSTASSSNTLPSVFSYQNNVGITLKTESTSPSAYQNGAKVASIENSVLGQVTDINIDSSKSEVDGNLISTGGAMYIAGLVATNPALFTMSENGNLIYYYNPSTNCVERKNIQTSETRQLYNGKIKQIKTNEDGSMLAMVDAASALYLVKNPSTTTSANFSSQATLVTSGAVSNLLINNKKLYYLSNNFLYFVDSVSNVSEKVLNYNEIDLHNIDPGDASLGSSAYRYYFYATYAIVNPDYCFIIYRRDLTTNVDTLIKKIAVSQSTYYSKSGSLVKANADGDMVIYKFDSNYYLVNSSGSLLSLGTNPSTLFTDDRLYYSTGADTYRITATDFNPVIVNNIHCSLDLDEQGNLIFVDNYSTINCMSKTYSYDIEKLIQIVSASVTNKPTSNAAIITTKFSTLPNQAIVQMENGDIYSIDTRTKTSRLLINNMALYDVLDQGRLLLSDMKDTGRFLIYDPTSNSKEVFRLDNRSTGAALTVQYNESAKTVYYLNNENKMQILQLTGAETQDKYALMLNNDNKWWVYKNNAWNTIYSGSDDPSTELMGSMGMTAAEVNAITEKDFQKLPENAKADTLRIAAYLHSSSPYATPVLKNIKVSTKDTEADLDSKTAYGTRIKEYNKADFRDIFAIHVTENKDSTDEIFYFLTVNDTLYSIRNGEVCDIGKDATQLFGSVKDNFMDVMSYGMSARELADFPADALKQTLITDNTTDKFGIVAVIKTVGKDTKEVKLDCALESLQKRFDDAVTTVNITLTDNTQLQYTSGEVTKEEIEKFADWVADRKYNRGPVFFTFHVGGKYKIINYYMIKMFSVE